MLTGCHFTVLANQKLRRIKRCHKSVPCPQHHMHALLIFGTPWQVQEYLCSHDESWYNTKAVGAFENLSWWALPKSSVSVISKRPNQLGLWWSLKKNPAGWVHKWVGLWPHPDRFWVLHWAETKWGKNHIKLSEKHLELSWQYSVSSM